MDSSFDSHHTNPEYPPDFQNATPPFDLPPAFRTPENLNFVNAALQSTSNPIVGFSPRPTLPGEFMFISEASVGNPAPVGSSRSAQQYSTDYTGSSVDLLNSDNFTLSFDPPNTSHTQLNHTVDTVPPGCLALDYGNINTSDYAWPFASAMPGSVSGPETDQWSAVAQQASASPQLPNNKTSRVSLPPVVLQPLKYQSIFQAEYSGISHNSLPFEKSPISAALKRKVYGDMAPFITDIDDSASNAPIGNQPHSQTQELAANLPSPEWVTGYPLLDYLMGFDMHMGTQIGYAPMPPAHFNPLAPPILPSSMDTGSTGHTGYTLNFPDNNSTPTTQFVSPPGAPLEPDIWTCPFAEKLGAGSKAPRPRNPSRGKSFEVPTPSDSVILPAFPSRPKRGFEDHSDNHHASSNCKRVSTMTTSTLKALGASSGSAITPAVAEPSGSTTTTTQALRPSAIPIGSYRESLRGIGDRYFNLALGHLTKDIFTLPKSSSAVKLYACKYICPLTDNACWNLDYAQDPEWRKTISKRRNKGYFSRHEAECLRHLAMHRYNEWVRSMRDWHKIKSTDQATEWDDRRIDDQIIRDIEQPDNQLWYLSEEKSRDKRLMIEWLKASRRGNKYNQRDELMEALV
ncbi:hypothetical protein RSOLAG1IB_08305 [Rhizoctonia solani AG-1 IB]|uniref:Uncharacterized protein n=1 Tax=Thanatephorus cucumeris (strain AG1-IB / isolate 7/3/14) TaxID=1108050 RepID=A0A0B7FLJ6_THACB|nr:hypothetical protein RSOLAG1IB_08305 [Rhizoctonia solani AG-1 IB]